MKVLKWNGNSFANTECGEGRSISLPNDVDAVSAIPVLTDYDLVVLTFPSFRDGRAFSQAARLRGAGFRGDIRAKGGLFLDQIGMAVRCGFTSLDLDEPVSAEAATNAAHRYTVFYQKAITGKPVWEVRT